MVTPQPYPILEFDPASRAILEPSAISANVNAPEYAVLCFFQDVISSLAEQSRLVELGVFLSDGVRYQAYHLFHNEKNVLVINPGLGAPMACASLEILISAGAKYFIACGSCGVLDRQHTAGRLFILSAAVRDEGTSYHYLPPGREARPHPLAVAALQAACQEQQIPYQLTKTWTTDAVYRETEARRALRVREGCEVVEMEAAAFFAVAQFRGVKFGQVVYGDDLVVPEGWEARGWDGRQGTREGLFWLAVDAVTRL